MILALFMTAALSTAGAAPAEQPADRMIAEATEWLLNGEPLPADMNTRLKRLAPADRARVVVFLRRSGMLTGPGWSVDDLLAPAQAEVAPR